MYNPAVEFRVGHTAERLNWSPKQFTFFYDQDTNQLYLWDLATWRLLTLSAPLPGSGVTGGAFPS